MQGRCHRPYGRKRRQNASGVRSLSVRSMQINAADAGNAYHDRPHNLRASGRAVGKGMKQNLQVRENDLEDRTLEGLPKSAPSDTTPEIAAVLLTGGIDRPYVFGLVTE